MSSGKRSRSTVIRPPRLKWYNRKCSDGKSISVIHGAARRGKAAPLQATEWRRVLKRNRWIQAVAELGPTQALHNVVIVYIQWDGGGGTGGLAVAGLWAEHKSVSACSRVVCPRLKDNLFIFLWSEYSDGATPGLAGRSTALAQALALPCLALRRVLPLIVWTENKNVTISDRFICFILFSQWNGVGGLCFEGDK